MISVCIATYNGEKYIKEQLNSILPQLSDDDEIIISDDGSTDTTLSIVKDYDRRIKVVRHNKRKEKFILDYPTHNFENALHYAKGDIIFLCDQDDVWLPEKVEKMVSDIQNGYLLSMCDCKICNEKKEILQESYFQTYGTSINILNLITHSRIMGCCMAIHKDLLQYAFPFPQTMVGHDLWLLLLAAYMGKAHKLDIPLMLYRRHEATVTPTGGKSCYPIWFRIYLRWFIIKAFICRIYYLKRNL